MVLKLEAISGNVSCSRCSRNADNKYIAISRYPDGGLGIDSYCVWCLPVGRAVLRVGADSTTVYDVYAPEGIVARYVKKEVV